jgi:hypothetical protein
MEPVSSAFLTEVQRSHTAVVRVELWSGTTFVRYLYPTDGSVTIDARRAVRRSASLTVVDEDGTLNPNSPNSLLTPFGSEVRIYRGVQYADGSTEYASLGVFRIVGVGIRLTSNGTELDVQLEDRSRVVQVSRYSTPYAIAGGIELDAAVAALVTSRYTGISTNVSPTAYVTGGTRVLGLEESDPWSDVVGLAEAYGTEAYFDADGVFTTTPIPSLTSASASVTFAEGSSSTLLNIRMDYSTADVYNGIIAKAESSSLTTPLESRAWDDDPSSPTRRTGPLGERPSEWSSSWVASQAQLDDVAGALLDTVRGFTVSMDVIPNPALDVRDVVQVTSTSIDLSSTVMVDTLTIPLSVEGTMTVTGRMRGY